MNNALDLSSNIGYWLVIVGACICFGLGMIAGGQR